MESYWRKCGPCKKPIAFGSSYFQCSVSTCRKNCYCSKDCWSAHVPVMRHKDAWAEEAVAPLAPDGEGTPQISKRIMAPMTSEDTPREILIVASKLKAYIKAESQLSTSAQVFEKLSEIVRQHCDRAIAKAKADGRKTVMDRDFQ